MSIESVGMYQEMLALPELTKGQVIKVLAYINRDLDNLEAEENALNQLKEIANDKMKTILEWEKQCKRCASPLSEEGRCSDVTCPYSDKDQECK